MFQGIVSTVAEHSITVPEVKGLNPGAWRRKQPRKEKKILNFV
jgi:hypothetical protein